MKKRFSLLFVAIFIFLMTMGNAFALPNQVTFKQSTLSGVGVSGLSGYYVPTHKTIVSGSATLPAYYIGKERTSLPNNSTLTLKQELKDNGYLYILSNGASGTWNSSLLGSDFTANEKYYITQLALSIYRYGTVSFNGVNARTTTLITAATKLANTAKTVTVSDTTVGLTGGNGTMYRSGDYYITDNYTVTGEGFASYKVTIENATSDVQIVASTGEVLDSTATLKAGTKFYVRVLASAVSANRDMKVKVEATSKVYRVFSYSLGNYQEVIVGSNSVELSAVETPLALTIDNTTASDKPTQDDCVGTLIVTKKDATTNKPLAGAKIVLKDSKGNIIDSWVSTKSAHYTYNLKAGNYTLVETKSPDGYELSDEIVKVTVPENTKARIEVVVYNSSIPVTANMNMIVLFAGFILTAAGAGFGLYKLNKQN